MKLFLKISNLCNHNTSALRTDRQTDRQTTCHGNTALCVASRGKNISIPRNHIAVTTVSMCYSKVMFNRISQSEQQFLAREDSDVTNVILMTDN